MPPILQWATTLSLVIQSVTTQPLVLRRSFTIPRGDNNVADGAQALFGNTDGGSNVGVGVAALSTNTAGPFNTAVGFQALMNATANANVAVGDLALRDVTTGFFNTAIGAAAGENQTTGHNNIYMAGKSRCGRREQHLLHTRHRRIEYSYGQLRFRARRYYDWKVRHGDDGCQWKQGDRTSRKATSKPLPKANPKPFPSPRMVAEDGHQAMLNLKVEKLQATSRSNRSK